MANRAKNVLIRIGSILVLVLGIVFFIGLVGLGLYFIFAYQGELTRKAIVVGAVFLTSIIEITITIAIFEGLSEVVHLEKLDDQLSGDKKWTSR